MKQLLRSFAEEPLTLTNRLPWLCLTPLGFLYGTLQRLRAFLYQARVFKSYRAPRQVISVGNLTVGGTGKTPVVDHIVRHLLRRGERPAVISRGYGGKVRAGAAIVSRGDGSGPLLLAAYCGDEPYLLARRNPRAVVIVAPKRREGVETAIRDCDATLIILDDGFQHLAVQRDLDILLLDARRPAGNGSVLPAGLLREPLSAHRRAQLCILTRDDHFAAPLPFPDLPSLRSRHRLARELVALDGTVQAVSDFSGRRGVAFAGIAKPEIFFKGLKELGLDLVSTVALDDHADFTVEVMAKLKQAAVTADFFVTTEKDGVKLRPSDLPLPCFQAPLEMEFSPDGNLEQSIDSFLKRLRKP